MLKMQPRFATINPVSEKYRRYKWIKNKITYILNILDVTCGKGYMMLKLQLSHREPGKI